MSKLEAKGRDILRKQYYDRSKVAREAIKLILPISKFGKNPSNILVKAKVSTNHKNVNKT